MCVPSRSVSQPVIADYIEECVCVSVCAFCQSACFTDFVEGFVCVPSRSVSQPVLLTLSKGVCGYLRVPSVSQRVLLKCVCVMCSFCQ